MYRSAPVGPEHRFYEPIRALWVGGLWSFSRDVGYSWVSWTQEWRRRMVAIIIRWFTSTATTSMVSGNSVSPPWIALCKPEAIPQVASDFLEMLGFICQHLTVILIVEEELCITLNVLFILHRCLTRFLWGEYRE